MKYCKGCKQTKELTEFGKRSRNPDGLFKQCKVCKNTRERKWKQNNREKCRASGRKWRENNREKCRERTRKYYKANREKRRAKHREWVQNNREKYDLYNKEYRQRPENKKRANARCRERTKTDPLYKIKKNLRCRFYHALKGKLKSARTMTLIGCSIPHLMDHLEQQFQPGMTWENYGTWHMDHMMPMASFDLNDPEQQRQCCHYTNLQPMWATENMCKNAKVIYNRTWNGFRWINNA